MTDPPVSTETRHISRSWVRTVYLYTMALLGLVLLTIGGIRILDLGLKAFVFTEAEQEERFSMRQPPMPMTLERMERIESGDEPGFSEEERAIVRRWIAEYEQWREQMDRIDPIASRRQRTASSALALILIGLPLYGYHWRTIRRE